VSTDRVTEILALLAAGQDRFASLPARLCQECVSTVSVTGVGLALMTAQGPNGVIVAATDGAARRMEELQFTLGEGPCVDASRSGRPVLHPDLLAAAMNRWPGFAAAALTAGVRAIFAFPLQVGAIRVGVLDLYRDTPGHLTDAQLLHALAFADAATLVLLHFQDGSAQSVLGGPLDGMARVHQATGMISVQLGVSLAEALLRLRAHAYGQDRPVADVAADVVGRRIRFDDSETGHSTEHPQGPSPTTRQ
jgi:GAF domain/ANTAR domain